MHDNNFIFHFRQIEFFAIIYLVKYKNFLLLLTVLFLHKMHAYASDYMIKNLALFFIQKLFLKSVFTKFF